jgi:tRNA pseudouridine38-40 synthase
MPETRRLKLIIAYDGRDFAGWQSQKHGNTIQDQIERSLAKICGRRVIVTGAGRTDAGVHAVGQCAHADVPTTKKRSALDWLKALNGTLPLTIRILRARFVSENFHARFSVRAKLYRYRILNTEIPSPFELGRAWSIAQPLDFHTLKEGATLFVGRHDFAGFAANRGKKETDTVRTIESARIVRRGEVIAMEFWGDGFLYKMVRMMVGALVRCALGKAPLETIVARLGDAALKRKDCFGETPKPTSRTGALPGARLAQHVFVAPAEGLYLVRIRY